MWYTICHYETWCRKDETHYKHLSEPVREHENTEREFDGVTATMEER